MTLKPQDLNNIENLIDQVQATTNQRLIMCVPEKIEEVMRSCFPNVIIRVIPDRYPFVKQDQIIIIPDEQCYDMLRISWDTEALCRSLAN